MKTQFYDVVVAKPYETVNQGKVEKRTAWNKVGLAWVTKNTGAICFELFLIPNQKYVVRVGSAEEPSFQEFCENGNAPF